MIHPNEDTLSPRLDCLKIRPDLDLSPRLDEVFIRPPSAPQLPTLGRAEAGGLSGRSTACPATNSKVGGSAMSVLVPEESTDSLRFHQTLLGHTDAPPSLWKLSSPVQPGTVKEGPI